MKGEAAVAVLASEGLAHFVFLSSCLVHLFYYTDIGELLVVLVVVFLCRQVCFKVRTHTQKKKCVVRECVIK